MEPARSAVRATLDRARHGVVDQVAQRARELPPRVASCVDGVLHAATVDPPPPREYPYDFYLNVAPR